MRLIATIEGNDITEHDDGSVTFFACGRIDDDGAGPAHGDKFHQGATSLHHEGQPLNADVDQYIVVPPQIIHGVKGIVLGCQAEVTYNGRTVPAVVGDIGPHHRLGEISIALARALGINPDPNTGGVDSHTVHYRLLPGIPAVVGSVTYTMQPSHAA
jgi:hypothetical protein